MTTKRKLIITALARLGTSILDDLTAATQLQRKNLQDNLKACIDEGLVDKLKDDVTGLPAYKVSSKGQKWLANTPNSSVTTQAVSGDITTASAHCATSLAVATSGKGADVIEPPTPDDAPAAVCSDEMKQLVIANDWLRCELTAANEELDRLREVIKGLNDAVFIAQQAVFNEGLARISAEDELKEKSNKSIGYTVILNTPDQLIHADLDSARREAQDYLLNDTVQNDTVHVAAIVDTAHIAITWKNAA